MEEDFEERRFQCFAEQLQTRASGKKGPLGKAAWTVHHNTNLTRLGPSPPVNQAALRAGSSLQPSASLDRTLFQTFRQTESTKIYCQAIQYAGLPNKIQNKSAYHISHRVLSFSFSRRNWDSPNPSPAGECTPPPPPVLGEGTHSLAREGLGESQFRRGDIHCGTLYIRRTL